MNDVLSLVLLMLAFAAIGWVAGYIMGFRDGRAREAMEPPRHGVMHMNDGPVIAGRPGVGPYRAIERLLREATHEARV